SWRRRCEMAGCATWICAAAPEMLPQRMTARKYRSWVSVMEWVRRPPAATYTSLYVDHIFILFYLCLRPVKNKATTHPFSRRHRMFLTKLAAGMAVAAGLG